MLDQRFKWIPDHKVKSFVTIMAERLDYNHKLMNIPQMWRYTRGSGVKVAVLDTGVPKHPDLMPVGGHSMIAGYLEDKNGHSTHCGGIIAAIANNNIGCAGIAPEVEDYYVAVLGPDGGGTVEDIVKGIGFAVDELGVDIISMSLGIAGEAPYIPELEAACNYAAAHGVAVIAAAGNEAGNVGQPAKYDSVIAVAAVDSAMQHANFSNAGPEVDFAAGGVNTYSTYLNNGYAQLSGTSMATPAVAAVSALILAKHKKDNEKLTPEELREHLRRIAYDVGSDGFDALFGNGIPIFGKDDEAPKVPVPVPPPPRRRAKAFGIEPGCTAWQLWESVIEAANAGLDNDDDVIAALRLALRQARAETHNILGKISGSATSQKLLSPEDKV